jgi:hypothetical protein
VRKLVITSTVGAAIVVTTACGAGSSVAPTPQLHSLQGTVRLSSVLLTMTPAQIRQMAVDHALGPLNGDTPGGPPLPDNWSVGQPCASSAGGANIQGGAQVVIKNSGGTIIGTGHLDAGTGIPPDPQRADPNENLPWCAFPFTIGALPDSDFYSINIGSRPAVTYSRSDMESQNWQVVIEVRS